MGLFKYVRRLERMDDLIRRKSTGNAKSFAGKLGISPSQIKEEINQMRQLGAKISFCRQRNSYVYENNCRLFLRFDIDGGEKLHRPTLSDDE
jgi:hypothetical protein